MRGVSPALSPAALARRGANRLQQLVSHGQKVVFIHLPKCGGTSIDVAFRRAIAPQGFGAVALDPQASRRAAAAKGEDLLDFRERWLLYQVARGRASFITGHAPWSPALAAVQGDYRLVTLLREPRAQLLSEFFFNRDKEKVGHFSIARGTPLKEFLVSPLARDIGSKYVQYFTDPALRATPTEPAAAEAAARNLASVDVVGTLEHLDRWVDAVAALTGRRLAVGRENTSPTARAQRDAEIDDDALALADEACRPNRTVYERALELGR